MKKIILIMMMILVWMALTSCDKTGRDVSTTDRSGIPPAAQQQVSSSLGPDVLEAPTSKTAITLMVNGQTFTATLLENEATHQLAAQFPLTLDMSELNGNEKYFYMDVELPVDSCQPGQINAGDLMLYGNNCLVLFYESFSSGYSYTRLGSVDDPSGLLEALGPGNAEITFSVRDDG